MQNKILHLSILALALSSFNTVANTTDGDHSVENRPFDAFEDFYDNSPGTGIWQDDDAHIGPGGGGQNFDAEYFFIKYDETSNNLSIGLQTGFDINDGRITYGGKDYFAGDIALSFDGDDSTYEYALDFGFLTKDYNDDKVDGISSGAQGNTSQYGRDEGAIYQVNSWNNQILHPESGPFAFDDGVYATSYTTDLNGSGFSDGHNNHGTDKSYYKVVTFNLADILTSQELNSFTVDANWTMSCGNDNINTNASFTANNPNDPKIPEPSIVLLLGIGSLGLILSGTRRKLKK